MPEITIQDFTPYQESFKWTLHHAYFQNTGSKAWLNGEIPYEITSNYRAAYQKAAIVIEALQTCQISNDETFNILEPAAGLGIFALNFIKAFEDICKDRQLNWFHQLHYMVSDYSVKSLQDMAKMPIFQAYKEEGRLDFYILDSTCPQNCSKLDENDFQLQPQSIFAVISNYQLTVLPVSILKIEKQQFFEKHIELVLEDDSLLSKSEQYKKEDLITFVSYLSQIKLSPEKSPSSLMLKYLNYGLNSLKEHLQTLANSLQKNEPITINVNDLLKEFIIKGALLDSHDKEYVHKFSQSEDFKLLLENLNAFANPSTQKENQELILNHLANQNALKLLDNLKENEQFVPFHLEDNIKDSCEQNMLLDLSKQYKQLTFLNFSGAYSFFREIKPFLKPKGLLLISDLAMKENSGIEEVSNTKALVYGNTLNYLVNFSLIETYNLSLGFQCIKTNDPEYSLQTLFLYNDSSIPKTLSQAFEAFYINECKNFDASYLIKAGSDYFDEEKYKMSRFFLRKALELNKYDPFCIYYYARSYLEEKSYQKALRVLEQPVFDHFGFYNFNFLKGEIYFGLKQYEQAKKYFLLTLNKPRYPKTLYYKLAQTYEKLKNYELAYQYYSQGIVKNPDENDCEIALNKLKRFLFENWIYETGKTSYTQVYALS